MASLLPERRGHTLQTDIHLRFILSQLHLTQTIAGDCGGGMKRNRRWRQIALTALTAVLFSSCASHVPEAIRKPEREGPSLIGVRSEKERYQGATVRWGGIILKVENLDQSTRLELMGYSLDRNGRPKITTKSLGRFIASSPKFLDPKIFHTDREVTLVGRVESVQRQAIGDYQYPYPIVVIDQIHLWPPRPEPSDDDWYYWGYPYWWYPYWGYPYYHYPYPHHYHPKPSPRPPRP